MRCGGSCDCESVVSFLAPAFFIAGVAAALGVVGLHFIVMRQPPSGVFPTVRFLPARPAVARTVARVPEDLLLLLVRVLGLLLIGAAFARPVLHPHRARVGAVVLWDRSRAARDAGEVQDSVRGVLRGLHGPAVLVMFDSGARSAVPLSAGDSTLPSVARVEVRGNVSAALVAGLHAAAAMRERADSIAITLVSPLVAEEVDAATDSIRALWPGEVRLVRVSARVDSGGVGLARPTMDWPQDGHAHGTVVRPVSDTVGGVVAGTTVLVAPFVRRWGFDHETRVLARWLDGEPAAVERVVGAGCEHSLAVPVPTAGDLVLREEWRRLVDIVRAPCGREIVVGGYAPAAWVTDTARHVRVAADQVGLAEAPRSRLVVWLLALGLLALMVEPAVRRFGVVRT